MSAVVIEMENGVVKGAKSLEKSGIDLVVRENNGESQPDQVYQITPSITNEVQTILDSLYAMKLTLIPVPAESWPLPRTHAHFTHVEYSRNGLHLVIRLFNENTGQEESHEFHPQKPIFNGFGSQVLDCQWGQDTLNLYIHVPYGKAEHFPGVRNVNLAHGESVVLPLPEFMPRTEEKNEVEKDPSWYLTEHEQNALKAFKKRTSVQKNQFYSYTSFREIVHQSGVIGRYHRIISGVYGSLKRKGIIDTVSIQSQPLKLRGFKFTERGLKIISSL